MPANSRAVSCLVSFDLYPPLSVPVVSTPVILCVDKSTQNATESPNISYFDGGGGGGAVGTPGHKPVSSSGLMEPTLQPDAALTVNSPTLLSGSLLPGKPRGTLPQVSQPWSWIAWMRRLMSGPQRVLDVFCVKRQKSVMPPSAHAICAPGGAQ